MQDIEELVNLIEDNNIEEIKKHIKQGHPLINVSGKRGFTPLQAAVFHSCNEIVAYLTAQGADVNQTLCSTVRKGLEWFEEGSTALHISCSKRQHELVKLLLAAGAKVNMVNGGAAQQSPLHVACEYGYLRSVEQLIAHGAEANLRDITGETALHKASKNGHSSVVMFLITSGAEVDPISQAGLTPLMMAVCEGHLKAVILLAENKANMSLTDQEGNGMLSLAALNKRYDIIPLLLDNQVDVSSENKNGDSALHLICKSGGGTSHIISIIEAGYEIDRRNHSGQSALHLAAQDNNREAVIQLIKSGADPNMADSDGKLAADYAADKDIVHIIQSGIQLETYIGFEKDQTASFNKLEHNFESAELVNIDWEDSTNITHPAQDINEEGNRESLNKVCEPASRQLETQKPGRDHVALNVDQGSKQKIGVDKTTVDVLKQQISTLENQILTLGISDDKAVVLYRQLGKLTEELRLARVLVKEHIEGAYRPYTHTPRTSNKNSANPLSAIANKKDNSRRTFNANFLVEAIEALKTEVKILKTLAKPSNAGKLTGYEQQVESISTALVIFAHMMSVNS